MGKLTILMAIFNSYVKLPEGITHNKQVFLGISVNRPGSSITRIHLFAELCTNGLAKGQVQQQLEMVFLFEFSKNPPISTNSTLVVVRRFDPKQPKLNSSLYNMEVFNPWGTQNHPVMNHHDLVTPWWLHILHRIGKPMGFDGKIHGFSSRFPNRSMAVSSCCLSWSKPR